MGRGNEGNIEMDEHDLTENGQSDEKGQEAGQDRAPHKNGKICRLTLTTLNKNMDTTPVLLNTIFQMGLSN